MGNTVSGIARPVLLEDSFNGLRDGYCQIWHLSWAGRDVRSLTKTSFLPSVQATVEYSWQWPWSQKLHRFLAQIFIHWSVWPVNSAMQTPSVTFLYLLARQVSVIQPGSRNNSIMTGDQSPITKSWHEHFASLSENYSANKPLWITEIRVSRERFTLRTMG